MKLKICGLTSPAQAAAVAEMGVDALGVIAATNSARFLPAAKRLELWGAVATANPSVLRVLVLVNPSNDQLDELRPEAGHQCLQLHGEESVERCAELQNELKLPIWKALRLRSSALQRLLYLFSCDDNSCRFFSQADVRQASSLLHAASSIRASSACGGEGGGWKACEGGGGLKIHVACARVSARTHLPPVLEQLHFVAAADVLNRRFDVGLTLALSFNSKPVI